MLQQIKERKQLGTYIQKVAIQSVLDHFVNEPFEHKSQHEWGELCEHLELGTKIIYFIDIACGQ